MSSNDFASARPRFYKQAVLNEAKTKVEGRPIYDEEEMVEMIIPGDRNYRQSFLAHEPYNGNGETRAEKYAEEYAAFKRGESRAASGTPLEMWPILTTPRVAELKALNILSVDELAALPDSKLKTIGMDGRQLRDQAKVFLETAAGTASNSAMAAEIAQLKEMLAKVMAANNAAVAPEPVVEQPAMQEKTIEEASDEELKAFIKEKTGSAPRGTPSRETLERMAAEAAQAEQEAA